MEKGDVLSITLFLSVLAGLSYLASHKTYSTARESAVAVAIEEEFSFFVEFYSDEEARSRDGMDYATLCIETQVALDFDTLAKGLASTVITPVPVRQCSSKRIEGDFGMFTAVEHWFDSRGERAVQIRIPRVHCPNGRSCVVDIDSFGSGTRYLVEKSGNVWSVGDAQLRWIV